jgi:DNA-binding NarL/FixJ family response regulator
MMDSAPSIRVLVCHEQPLTRAGLRAILEREPGIEVVGEARTAGEAVAVARRVRPTVVIMDIAQPCPEVIEAIGLLSAPSVEQPIGVVALATTVNNEVIEAVRAGARGLVLKNCPAEELIGATRAVAAGEGFVTPRIAGRLLEEVASRLPPPSARAPMPMRGLTRRELEILRRIAQGQSNAEIAAALSVSEATVRSHVHHLLSRLDLRDRAQAVVFAYETGLVRPGLAS